MQPAARFARSNEHMPRGKEAKLMANELGFQTSTLPGRVAAILILAAPVLAFSLAAQQQGPLASSSAPEAAQPAPPSHASAASPAPVAKPQSETTAITHEPP